MNKIAFIILGILIGGIAAFFALNGTKINSEKENSYLNEPYQQFKATMIEESWAADYLRKNANRFPASPVDKLVFYNPTLDSQYRFDNVVQINFTLGEIAKVSKKLLLDFFTTYVDVVQKFNCVNHSEALDRGVVIYNRLLTREYKDLGGVEVPIIQWFGREVVYSEGFETNSTDCEKLKLDEKLKVNAIEDPLKRLHVILNKELPKSLGSGWVLPNGLVVTNNHVVQGANKIFLVRADRNFVPAEVLYNDELDDLALLKVDDIEFLPPSLAFSKTVPTLGSSAFTIGYPWTSGSAFNSLPEVQLSTGIISSILDNGRRLQLSMPVHGGNSGGPLFNKDGNVIGVISAKLAIGPKTDQPENVSFAVRVERLIRPLDYFSEKQRVATIQLPKAEERSLEALAPMLKDSILLVLVF
jgi:S1-C subfamily serine protease